MFRRLERWSMADTHNLRLTAAPLYGEHPRLVMTIAGAVVLQEGVVFGADSTSTVILSDETQRHYNHHQKLFEVGSGSSIGLLTWGLGSAHNTSYRTLVADFAEQLAPSGMADVATQWAHRFWDGYSKDPVVTTLAMQAAKVAADPSSDFQARLRALQKLQDLKVGFCIGGHVASNRTPEAYVV